MAAIWVALLASDQYTSPGIYICPITGFLFGGLGYFLGRERSASFRDDADKLERAIRQAVLR